MYLLKFKLFSRPPVSGAERLFYKLAGLAESVNDSIVLPRRSSVLLDTFFNCLSAKYLKFARCDNLRAEVVFSGSLCVQVRFRSPTEDKLLASEELSSSEKLTAYVNIPDIAPEEGFVYLRLRSSDNSTVFYGGGFCTDSVPKKIKLGIIVCTYCREEFVIRNMRCFADYLAEDPSFADRAGVFVVDNGRTLTTEELPDFVNLIPNDNTGGAGGFTRGLKEVLAAGEEYTHFLFMDDDVVFMPQVVDRTIGLLALLKEEYSAFCIGGAMLNLTCPMIQHEFGGKWLGNMLKGNRKDIDVSTVNGLLMNETDLRSDYNAWWYMCMPLSSVRKHGLPLEMLFIKCDDVEYGLRAAEGFISVNGIAVWHENFNWKFNPAMEYFVKRNELIVNSRFPRDKGFFSNWAKMVVAVSKALVEFRYFHIEMIERAYMDFLKGAEYVKSIDHAAFLEEVKLRFPKHEPIEKFAAEYGFSPAAELAKSNAEPTRKLVEVITLNGYFLPRTMYRKWVVADMVYPKPVNFYRTAKAINYNPYTGKAFVTEIDKSKLFYGLWKIIKITFAMLLKYRKARRTYLKENPEYK